MSSGIGQVAQLVALLSRTSKKKNVVGSIPSRGMYGGGGRATIQCSLSHQHY